MVNYLFVFKNLINRFLVYPIVYKNFWNAYLNTLRIKKHGCYKVELRSGEKYILRSGPEDIGTLDEVYVGRYYDKKDFEIKPEDIVFDIGAYIGDFTVYASKRARKGKVYAFEPIQSLYELANNNICLNNCKNVKLFNYGISNKDMEAFFDIGGEMALASASMFNMSDEHKNKQSGSELATIKSIANWLKTNKNIAPTYLKIDCEGAEFDIIYNIPITYFLKIRVLIIEYHNIHKNPKNNSSKLKQYMENMGYHTYDTGGMIFSNIGLLYCCKK